MSSKVVGIEGVLAAVDPIEGQRGVQAWAGYAVICSQCSCYPSGLDVTWFAAVSWLSKAHVQLCLHL